MQGLVGEAIRALFFLAIPIAKHLTNPAQDMHSNVLGQPATVLIQDWMYLATHQVFNNRLTALAVHAKFLVEDFEDALVHFLCIVFEPATTIFTPGASVS